MNSKKSMRIFLVTLFLLIISGCVILGLLRIKTIKNQKEHMTELAKEQPVQPDVSTNQKTTVTTVNQSIANRVSTTTTEAVRQTGGVPVHAKYEIRVEDGYLNVYDTGLNKLYFHTGIALDTLEQTVQKEILEGKFFENEQELYGYLESCTS